MTELNARILPKKSSVAAEIPSASDLEVAELAVNTADGKLFTKHTDGSVVTISGGGAVDSVNGQTGTVSLGIQDMNDYALNLSDGSTQILNYKTDTIEENDPSGYYKIEADYIAYLDADASVLSVLVNGTSVTFTAAGLTHETTVSSDPSYWGPGRQFFYISDSWPAEFLALPAGTSLTIASTVISTSPVPLASGDILRWNDTEQKFKPAQVTQRIQDMDDFALNNLIFSDRIGVWSEEWPPLVQNQNNDFPELPGRWGSYDLNDPEHPLYGRTFVFVASTDSEGVAVDVADVLADPTDYGLILVVDGVAQTPVRLVAASIQAEGARYRFDWLTTDLSGNAYGEIYSTMSPIANPGPYYNTLEVYFELWGDGLAVSQVPLAEGDILQWNNADQKFKPAQLPAGGAVDSVNGETGAVSLGVQDMDDFELNATGGGEIGAWDTKLASTGFPNASGEWRVYASDTPDILQLYRTDKDGIDRASELLALVAGTIFEFSADGGQTYQGVTVLEDASWSAGGGGDKVVNIKISDSDGALIGSAAGLVDLRYPIGQDIPLAEGDILQWVGADEKFKPAQLPATIEEAPEDGTPYVRQDAGWVSAPSGGGGGGAVDSVNGETGVVSLGIQDMNDFELNTPANNPQGIKWSSSAEGTSGNAAYTSPDTAGFSEVGGSRWFIINDTEAANGYVVDQSAFTVGTEVTFYHQGGVVTSDVTQGFVIFSDDGQGNIAKALQFNNLTAWPANWTSTAEEGPIYADYAALNPKPFSSEVKEPLATGDILQWSNAEQKFKPAQLPAGGGGGAVDSVNGETGVVSLGIQDMDDFGLNVSPSGFSSYDFTDSWSSPPANPLDNRYFVNTSGSTISINWTLNDGSGIDTDLQTDVGALLAGDVITVSLYERSSTVYYLTLESAPSVYNSAGYSLSIVDDADWQAFADEDPNGLPEGLRVVVGDEREVPLVDLAEGDILQWVDADQKFKPTALAPVAISGDYNDLINAPAGGGGAVDSVNGQTGTVSLGIQDMDDYYRPSEYVFDAFITPQSPNEPGQWHLQEPGFTNNLAFALEDANGAATSVIKDLPIGSSIWLNGVEFTTDGNGGSFSGGGSVGSWFLPILEDLSTLDTSGGLTITIEGPIADGDILQWVEADQKFRPAQLPAGGGGGGAVDSVNGKTGVVSLGIQEMDDFELSATPPVSYSYPNYQGGGDVPQAAGYFREFGSSGDYGLQFHDNDENGSDLRAAFLLLSSPGSIWLSSDGVNFSEEPYETLITGSSVVNFKRTTSPWNQSSPLFLSLSDPGFSVDIPLAEGDILQWVGADEKFKPAQLPATIEEAPEDGTPYVRQDAGWVSAPSGGGGGGAVDSVNGETGVVSLGIQDMDDFKGYQAKAEYGLTNKETTSGVGPSSWFYEDFGSGYFDYGENGYDSLDNLSSGDEVTFEAGGFTHTTTLTTEPTGNTASSRFFRVADHLPRDILDLPTGTPLVIRSSSLPLTDVLPTLDGQVLAWSDVDSKWTPTALASVATSGDYNDLINAPSAADAPVTSVNGETGVVSLGIQDMDDFKGYQEKAEYGLTNKETTPGVGPSSWFYQDLGSGYFDYGENGYDSLDNLSSGDEVTFEAGGFTHTTTLTTNPASNTSVSRFFRVADHLPSGILDLPTGTPLVIRSSSLPLTDVPILDGQVLAWSDVDSKWTPSAADAPVTSVNTETGDVSLGIQDMDDFELNQETGSYRGLTTKKTNIIEIQGPGDYFIYNNQTNNWTFAYHNNASNALSALSVGDGVVYKAAGATDFVTTIRTPDSFNSDDVNYLQNVDQWPSEWVNLPEGTSIQIVSTSFSPSDLPLAEGDILRWNDADQKFQPAQVTQRIQDMDDFELNQSTGGNVSFANKLAGNPSSTDTLFPDEWQSLDSGSNGSFWIYLPKNAETQLLVGGTEVTIQLSTGFSFTTTVDNNNSSAAEVHPLKWESPHPTELVQVDDAPEGTSLTILSTVLPEVADLPLAEGDILQWVEADQKFKPAQLPVDSVNGETGVVSLGVQDMDDFELAYAPASETWSTPNTGNPGAEQFRLYALGGARLSTTTANGYRKDELLSYLTLGANLEIIVNSVTHTATVTSSPPDLIGEGGPAEYIGVAFNVSPALSNTNLADSSLVINFLDVGAVEYPLAEGDILQWNNTKQKFKPAQLPAGGSSSRSQASVATSALGSGSGEDVTLPGTGKAGQFMSVTTDGPAWIVFYADEASRTADASRLETISPSPGSGVLMEVITTAAETIIVSPVVNYFNNESPPVASLPLKVTNKDATTRTVQVDVKLLATEA